VTGLDALVGSWRLLSVEATVTDTGEKVATFGQQPSGRVVVTPDCRIMFLITRSDREKPGNDTEQAMLFNATIAYSGLVRMDGPGALITTVEISLFPEEIGTEKRRLFSIDGNRLTITRPAQTSRVTNGRVAESRLVWARET
jgi:hypothetical protein